MNKLLVSILLLFSIAALSAQEMTIDSAGDVNIENNLTVKKSITTTNDITAERNVTVENTLTVTKTADLNGPADLDGGLNVENGTLEITNDATTVKMKNVQISGTTNFYNNVTIGTAANKKPLVVNGNTTMNGTTTANDNVTLTKKLTVSGTTTLNGVTNFNNTANLKTTNITGTITASGTTNLNGQTNLKNTTVNGNVTVNGAIHTSQGVYTRYQYKSLTLQPIQTLIVPTNALVKNVTVGVGKNNWYEIDLSDIMDKHAPHLAGVTLSFQLSVKGDTSAGPKWVYFRPKNDGTSNPTSADQIADSGIGYTQTPGTSQPKPKVSMPINFTVFIPANRMSSDGRYYIRSQRDFTSTTVRVEVKSINILW